MWVQVRVEVGIMDSHVKGVHVDPKTGLLVVDMVQTEQTLTGIMWARSEDLPRVLLPDPLSAGNYKRTVQVYVGDGMFPEHVFRLDGAWSPKPGLLIADKFEEITATPAVR